MITQVPWQHWAVIVEIWFSLLLLARFIDQGRIRYSWRRFLWFPWDFMFLGLFVWGCTSLNVAGAMYLILCLMGMVGAIRKTLVRQEYAWDSEEVKVKAVNGSAIIGGFMTLLVVLST